MVITLTPELEVALNDLARRQGVAAEVLAEKALRKLLLSPAAPIQPRDEWEQRLLGVGSDCGGSLPHAALSREELYE